jgi:glycosyltransferase involved in cell wall biosynthesis
MKQNKPLVSICCLTYNHAKYVRQCLDSFITQQTSFDIEILIHDDASTDGTDRIIKEYEREFPSIVFPVYQSTNQYSLGVSLSQIIYSRVRGKYIATCEGDDYWLDPYKLEKQVSFLEKNPSYTCCGHLSVTIYDFKTNSNVQVFSKMPNISGIITKRKFYKAQNIHTSSLVYRSDLINRLPVHRKELDRDNPFKYWLLTYGPIKVLGQNMSVYRRNKGGVSEQLSINQIYQAEIATSKALGEELKEFHFQAHYLKSRWHYYYLCNGSNLSFVNRLNLFLKFSFGSFYRFPFNILSIFLGILKVFSLNKVKTAF